MAFILKEWLKTILWESDKLTEPHIEYIKKNKCVNVLLNKVKDS